MLRFIVDGAVKTIGSLYDLRKSEPDTKVECRFWDNEKERQGVCILSYLAYFPVSYELLFYKKILRRV